MIVTASIPIPNMSIVYDYLLHSIAASILLEVLIFLKLCSGWNIAVAKARFTYDMILLPSKLCVTVPSIKSGGPALLNTLQFLMQRLGIIDL